AVRAVARSPRAAREHAEEVAELLGDVVDSATRDQLDRLRDASGYELVSSTVKALNAVADELDVAATAIRDAESYDERAAANQRLRQTQVRLGQWSEILPKRKDVSGPSLLLRILMTVL